MTDSTPRFDSVTGLPLSEAETVLRNVAPAAEKILRLVSMTEEEESAVEKIAVFEIDDVVYSIEKRPRVHIALGYLRLARKEGQDAAVAYLLEESLGEDGFEALCGHRNLKPEDFEGVMKIIRKHVLGGLEAGK